MEKARREERLSPHHWELLSLGPRGDFSQRGSKCLFEQAQTSLPSGVQSPILQPLGSPSDLSGYDVLIGDISSLQFNFKGLPCRIPTGQLLQGLL